VLAWIELAEGQSRTVSYLWMITRGAHGLGLALRHVGLPDTQTVALERANEAARSWHPSREDLDAIAAAWEGLPPAKGARPTAVESEIITPEGFDQALRDDPRSRDALWVVRQTQSFAPEPSAPAEQALMLAVRERRNGGYQGDCTLTVTAMAPFPLPITWRGSFQLYRLDTSRRSWAGRLLDALRGRPR
jgi:hypothetical protein